MAETASWSGQGPGRSVVAASLWRARWVILAAALVAGIGGFLLSLLQPASYTAQSRMVLSASQNFDPLGGTSFGDATRFVANQVSIIGTLPVLQDAQARLDDGTTVEDLEDSLDVSASSSSDVITVAASAPSAEGAAARADAVVAAYQAYSAGRVASEAADAADATTDEAIADQIRTQAAVYGDGVAVVETALTPVSASSPRPLRDAVVLAVVAALVAATAAVWRRSPSGGRAALAKDLGARTLGTVPVRSRGKGAGALPVVRAADAAEVLVSLDYAVEGSSAPVLFTGTGRLTDTSVAVHAVAAAAAAAGRRVLVVDAGAGQLGVDRHLGVSRPVLPLTRMAGPAEAVDVEEVLARVQSRGGRGEISLAVLDPSGEGRVSPADEVGTALAIVTEIFDMVIIAAAPLDESAEAFALVRHAGPVVAVTDTREDADSFEALHERLAAARRSLAGVVLTAPVKATRESDRRGVAKPTTASGTTKQPAREQGAAATSLAGS